MSNEQEIINSNGKLSSILNPTPTIDTSGQETSQDTQNNNKETTTTNGSGKTTQKIKKEFKNSKEPSSSKNEGSTTTTTKSTTKPATKNSKQSKTTSSKTAATTKSKPSKSSRKRPLSPSDSEEGRETSQELERCQHPKHDEYMKSKPPTLVVNSKRAKLDKPPKLVGMPKRLEGVLNIDRGTKMCSRCINQTDKDPQYTSHKKYVSRKSVYKKNERSRLMIDMTGK